MKIRNKKRNGKRRTSSEDDVALALSPDEDNQNGVSNILSLRKWSVEKCEFCEEVFYDKFSILVHNTKHIIIPLLKQKYYQCLECLHHFTSLECLEWHTINEHPNITRNDLPELLKSFVSKEPMILVNTPAEVNDTISKKESLLLSFVKREPITVLMKEDFGEKKTGNAIQEISGNSNAAVKCENDNRVTKNDIKNESVDVKSDVDNESVVVKSDIDYDYDNDYYEYDSSESNGKRIKDRLCFEDEEDNHLNGFITDLTTDCKVNLDVFANNWINSLQKADSINKNAAVSNDLVESPNVWGSNSMVLGKNTPMGGALNEEKFKSVHFDELMEPDAQECSKCNKTFPNRYSAIIHETSHMTTKRRRQPFLCRICDWYISTGPRGLHRHVVKEHPDAVQKSRAPSVCEECGFIYVSRPRHFANYHKHLPCTELQSCDKELLKPDVKDQLSSEQAYSTQRTAAEEWSTKIVRVCDLCYSFFKNKTNLNYVVLGEENQVGEMNSCERCQKNFFSLKVVQLKHRKFVRHIEQSKRKPLSNVERLKHVHQRFKKLKSLNKF